MTKTKAFVEGPVQHVVHNPGAGGWQVKAEGSEKTTHVREEKIEAIEIAREIAQANYTQLIVHDEQGNITAREDYRATVE